ncbi:sulfatase family protein [Gaetbulibacter aestuarii]|uniref:Arylsulfatase n=1 Tax=Gaetbulibacter aestuarii TaxID=1502358 RepID=A0ABW7N2N0_9FLAO
MKKVLIFSFTLLAFLSCKKQTENKPLATEISKPNIIIFYVDDLGYGDLGCYGATDVKTPHVDRLANNGIRFTDAHSSAATCTPSRYSMLTGVYAFRKNAAILPGDAPLLIPTDTYTLPKMLKNAGYATGVVGKWHLGLGNGNVDWNTDVKPGPLEIGFDYSFLIPATPDRVPTAYLENHNIINLSADDSLKISYTEPFENEPTGLKNPELLRFQADEEHSEAIVDSVSRMGYQTGGKSAMWTDEDFPNILIGKAKDFIEDHKSEPFFLYFSFTDIHVPRLPNKKFQGKTNMGNRGDAIVQMDWITGAIMEELERLHIDKNTLIIFSSDNGPILNDGYEDGAVELLGDHKPGGPYSGGKYSALEAATRVPMITYWPDQIKNPGVSDALISQIDYFASLAALLGQPLTSKEAIDSQNLLPAIVDASQPGRKMLLEESFTLGLRKGSFKYIQPMGKNASPGWMTRKKVALGFKKVPQLYDLSNDKAETHNVAQTYPELVKEMQADLDSIKSIK